MRLMLIVLSVAVAMLLDFRVSQAAQMPWCAGTNTGRSFTYNCSLPTYEMCVQEVASVSEPQGRGRMGSRSLSLSSIRPPFLEMGPMCAQNWQSGGHCFVMGGSGALTRLW
jgi:hypothetical protein